MGWRSEYQNINGTLFCTISVWDNETDQWVAKQDCGTESNIEKKKGEASDAFKRAATAWGIGRELYTRLFIWVDGGTQPMIDKSKNQVVKNGKPQYELCNTYLKWNVDRMDVGQP
ncbi:hypothetical protein LJC56_03080 [Christensenellaceae bacterium OttesenSCG-928-K19]|nr:hypothetical protein [Christensenellaceae bacterium OttesenSCG-928-K19]